jgi:hypothetical protein
MAHLQRIVPFSDRASSRLAWLEGGSNQSSLLTVSGRPDLLHYKEVSGNTDAVRAVGTWIALKACRVPAE